MAEIRLLVMSDDFGMCHGVNTGIVRGFSRGILGGTNLMVPCPWFEEAAALVRREGIPSGIHLTVTGEWRHFRCRPLTGSTSIADEDGYFFPNYASLASQAREEDMFREYIAQIRLAKKRVETLYHADFHMLVPPAFTTDPFEKRALEIGQEAARQEGLTYLFRSGGSGLQDFDTFFSISGEPRDRVFAHLENLGPGTHCLITHCGEDTPELSALTSPQDPAFPWTSPYRTADLAFVESPEVRSLLERRGIRVISLRDWHRELS